MLMSRLRYTMCRIRFLIRSQFFIRKIASFHAVSNYESSFTFDTVFWQLKSKRDKLFFCCCCYSIALFFHWRNSFQPSTVAISDVIAKWPTECQHTTKCKATPTNGNWTSFYFWARDLCRPTKRLHPMNRDVWSVESRAVQRMYGRIKNGFETIFFSSFEWQFDRMNQKKGNEQWTKKKNRY